MKTLKAVTFNYNTTIEEIEALNTGDRLTIQESGKVGGVWSWSKKSAEDKFLYTIILVNDKGLLFEVFFLRPTNG